MPSLLRIVMPVCPGALKSPVYNSYHSGVEERGKMRRILLCLLAAASLMLGQAVRSQEKSAAGLISILADPERFNGKQVTVIGFLLVEHQPKHVPAATLF